MDTPPPSFASRVWQLVFYGGATSNRRQRDEAYVINVFSMLTLVSVLIFGASHIFDDNLTLGLLELMTGLIVVLNAIVLRLTHNTTITRDILLTSILALLLLLLVTGGMSGTGVFWIFVFPVVTFFLTGKKRGNWWMAALYCSIGFIALAKYYHWITVPYSLIALRQLVASLTVTAIGVFVYQEAREKALRETEESRRDLREYLDHMTTFSVKIGVDGRVMFANKTAREMSGLGKQVIGQEFLKGAWWTFDDEVQQRVEGAFYKALAGKQVNYDEKMRIATTSGEHILTVNFGMMPIFEDNRIKYILAEARDISAEEQIDRAKSKFVGLASRQLREPVSTVAWAVDALLSDTSHLNPDQRHQIQQIYHSNRRMQQLIDNMLLVSSLELANLPVNPTETDVRQLSRDMVKDTLAHIPQTKKLNITEDYADDLPTISADPKLVNIILHNLLVNAAAYTPDGGRINVRITRTEQKLHVGSKGCIQVEIQDSGRGIPPADQKKIFTKFYRAGNVQEKGAEGTGLGLYIVRILLDYVGGNVSFTSKEHIGTIFVVLMPLEGMPQKIAPPATPPSA